jgi:uncharacterized membrane protein
MYPSPLHHFPVAPVFMLLLFIVFVTVVVLVEVGVFSYAYEKMGIGRRHILAILMLSLLGSTINIPIAQLPVKNIVKPRTVNYFGVLYVVPEVERLEETTIAVNLGGAVIPTALSLYLLFKKKLFVQAAIGVTIMTLVVHWLATPVKGVGIAMPWLMPPVMAALTAWLISRENTAPLAYISGSMGCLLGADILNLHRIAELGSPMVSIGGAGISDGIFLTGIIAVLLA